MDRLFSLEHFDERDLVQVDVKVRDYIKSKKEVPKDTIKSEKSTVKQATLASARQLEGQEGKKL